MLLILKAKLKWNNILNDMTGQQVYETLFRHRCILNGHIYSRAPVDMVSQHVSKLAIKRGFTACRSSGKPWSYYQACGPGVRARTNDHMEAATEKGYDKDAALLFPIGQNVAFYSIRKSLHMPALLGQSFVYSRRLERCLLPCEHLEVQGLKYFETANPESSVKPELLPAMTDNIFPQRRLIDTMLDSQARQAAGNAMHLSSVMAAICLIIGRTSDVDSVDSV